MSRFTVKYEEKDGNKIKPKKIDLSQFEGLKNEDMFYMEDGKMFGMYMEKLSAFETNQNKEQCKMFLELRPTMTYTQNSESDMSLPVDVFDSRHVVSKEGYAQEQLLIKYMNDPAWINIDEYAKVVRLDSNMSAFGM